MPMHIFLRRLITKISSNLARYWGKN